MDIRCLAIDDEPLALAQLANYIEKTPGLKLVGRCGNGLEALTMIQRGGIDLIFCDISMPDLSGMELVRQIGGQCLVVFTTAYPDYAIEGYKVNAVDYLLKPFSLSDVMSAAIKAKERLNWRDAQENKAQAEENSNGKLGLSDYIYVKNDFKMSHVKVSDITLVEGMSEYVRIHVLGEEKPLTTLLSMKKVEAVLPSGTFMRVHRSWIVNLDRIESVSHLLISIGGRIVPVSDNYKDRFVAYMDSHAMK